MKDLSLKIGKYGQVVCTDDEWEDLIGIVENFYDAENNKCSIDEAVFIELYFPLDHKDQKQFRLTDVNEFTSYVRGQLRSRDNEEGKIFPIESVEAFDENNL